MPVDTLLTNDPLLVTCRELGQAMDRFDAAAGQRLRVGRSDLRALNLLEDGPLAAAVLADRLGLQRGSVTALVDRLAAAGFVRRTPDPNDRRGVQVELEPATWQAFAEVYRPLGQQVLTAVVDLDEGQRAVVADAVRRMVGAFETARTQLISP